MAFSSTSSTASRFIMVLPSSFQFHLLRRFSSSTSTSSSVRVGFIGLGNMGANQANNLLKKGYQLTVFDLNQQAVQNLVSKGAKSANSPKEIGSVSDVVITMLPSSPHVKEVYLGPNGLLASNSKLLLIDNSTIDPMVAREVATTVVQKGSSMVDAPVSGGTMAAEAGTLTFMCGGPKEVFEKAKPFLQAMGKNIVYCGDSGSGQVVKICNNLILGISMIGVSEAMNLGRTLGVDPKVLASVINTSSGRCWSSDTYNPCPGVMENVPAARGYTGGFMSDLMKKDLGLAVNAAEAIHARLSMGNKALSIYEELSKAGFGGKDFSSVFQFINQQSEQKK